MHCFRHFFWMIYMCFLTYGFLTNLNIPLISFFLLRSNFTFNFGNFSGKQMKLSLMNTYHFVSTNNSPKLKFGVLLLTNVKVLPSILLMGCSIFVLWDIRMEGPCWRTIRKVWCYENFYKCPSVFSPYIHKFLSNNCVFVCLPFY